MSLATRVKIISAASSRSNYYLEMREHALSSIRSLFIAAGWIAIRLSGLAPAPPVKEPLSGPIRTARLFGLRLEEARVSVSACEGIFLEHPLKKKKRRRRKDLILHFRAERREMEVGRVGGEEKERGKWRDEGGAAAAARGAQSHLLCLISGRIIWLAGGK